MKRIYSTIVLCCIGLGLTAQSQLNLHLNPMSGTNPMLLNQNFSEYNGRTTVMDRLQFYLSNFFLVHDGGTVTPLPNNYLLVTGTRPDYSLGTSNIVNIEKIRFSVGVDATVNHNDPATWPTDHPLAFQNPSMHWGWNAGYKFAAFEGEGDNNNDNIPETMWQLHPTGDQLLRSVEVVVTPTIDGNGTHLNLEYDMQAWLRDIDLPTIGAQHSSTGDAVTVMDNINTYNVFRSAGTVGVIDAKPEAISLYFNYSDMERPIAHYRVLDGQGQYAMTVTNLQGQLLFHHEGLPSEGKVRVESKLAQGMYICSLLKDGQTIYSKKFQVSR